MLRRSSLYLINRLVLRPSLLNSSRTNTTNTTTDIREPVKIPSRPSEYKNEQLTKYVESKAEFEHVKKLIPNEIVPDPPQHESYPTPSGWIPVDVEKAKKWPYYVLRTRYHNYPIYREIREGGSRKLIRIKYIQGDIWQFDRDLRAYLEKRIENEENIKRTVYTSVNEVQRQVLVKGFFEEYISEFLKEKGF